jgi:WD40 repeat protein
MRTFTVGDGRVHAITYSPNSRSLIVDVREELKEHPFMGYSFRPARELVWWDWTTGTVQRRFRLRDSLYGPGGAQTEGNERGDWAPESAAFDVAWCPHPLRVATAWEWTNKEDGVCVFDPNHLQVIDLQVHYKTHVERLALAPQGDRLALHTVNDMDGFAMLETWDLEPAARPDSLPLDVDDLIPWEDDHQRRNRQTLNACRMPFRRLSGFAFNGQLLAAAGPEQPTVWIWRPGSVVPETDSWGFPLLPEPPATEVGFAPHCLAFARGVPLLAVGGAGLTVHDTTANHWTALDRTGPVVSAGAFTADGRLLLAGTEAGSVELWDVDSRRCLKALDWRSGPITALAPAPDGFSCAAGTAAGAVVVWDLDV